VIVGPNIVVNPGFESGVGTAWQLLVVAPAAATIGDVHTNPASGRNSAVVSILQGSDSRAAIALEQGPLTLSAGTRYQLSLTIRSTESRDIRVQVVSASGNAYATHLFAATTSWSEQSFEFTALASDATTRLRIELGGSSASVYLDDVGLAPVE
jgi:hypothetical protein